MSLVPAGAQSLRRALHNSNGQKMTLVYNEGQAVIHDNYDQNIAIYNAPGAICHFVKKTYKCEHCEKEFNSADAKAAHDVNYPKTCSQHYDCFSSWDTHVDQYTHTKCPIKGCAKANVDFGSDSRFMQHYRNKH